MLQRGVVRLRSGFREFVGHGHETHEGLGRGITDCQWLRGMSHSGNEWTGVVFVRDWHLCDVRLSLCSGCMVILHVVMLLSVCMRGESNNRMTPRRIQNESHSEY